MLDSIKQNIPLLMDSFVDESAFAANSAFYLRIGKKLYWKILVVFHYSLVCATSKWVDWWGKDTLSIKLTDYFIRYVYRSNWFCMPLQKQMVCKSSSDSRIIIYDVRGTNISFCGYVFTPLVGNFSIFFASYPHFKWHLKPTTFNFLRYISKL